MVDCPGCKARHLIADRKGWFGDAGSVESFLVRLSAYCAVFARAASSCRNARSHVLSPCGAQAERGEAVVRRGGAGEDALEISAEELAGWAAHAPPPPLPPP
jgi:hypothetical protein